MDSKKDSEKIPLINKASNTDLSDVAGELVKAHYGIDEDDVQAITEHILEPSLCK